MSKYFFFIVFFLTVIPKSFSQPDFSNYSYVSVPEQWDFLNQEDKYQLNSLAKFLFNKHGFNALFSKETMATNRCDGLYAELANRPGIIWTKLAIVLKDCNGFEVYRSPEGLSKRKEYSKAYQEALREAFAYFETMRINQTEVSLRNAEGGLDTPTNVTMEDKPLAVKESISEMPDTEVVSNLPEARFSSYKFKGNTYLMRKTDEGYSLYEETSSSVDGLLLIGKIEMLNNGKLKFVDTFGSLFEASFDAAKNFTIQKGTSPEVYKHLD